MIARATHSFNPAPILVGSTRNKSAGWSKGHPTTTKAMLHYNQNAVKGIVNERPHRLLGFSAGADRDDLPDLLGHTQIARRDGCGVGPQNRISDHVYDAYSQHVGVFGSASDSQDKLTNYLLAYLPLGCLDRGVSA